MGIERTLLSPSEEVHYRKDQFEVLTNLAGPKADPGEGILIIYPPSNLQTS